MPLAHRGRFQMEFGQAPPMAVAPALTANGRAIVSEIEGASMEKLGRKLAAGLLVASFGVIGSALPAAAEPGPGPGREFGQHVVACNDHFSGEHNPGVHHRGFSGWPMHDDCN